MIIKKDGCLLETTNEFVIEQLLKYGGKEVKEKKPKSNK